MLFDNDENLFNNQMNTGDKAADHIFDSPQFSNPEFDDADSNSDGFNGYDIASDNNSDGNILDNMSDNNTAGDLVNGLATDINSDENNWNSGSDSNSVYETIWGNQSVNNLGKTDLDRMVSGYNAESKQQIDSANNKVDDLLNGNRGNLNTNQNMMDSPDDDLKLDEAVLMRNAVENTKSNLVPEKKQSWWNTQSNNNSDDTDNDDSDNQPDYRDPVYNDPYYADKYSDDDD